MRESETFGIEAVYAERAIEWMNEQAKKNNLKFEARTYNSEIKTKKCFSSFKPLDNSIK